MPRRHGLFGLTSLLRLVNDDREREIALCLWIFALPADCVKNRMMSQRDVIPRPYPTLFSCIQHIRRVEGLSGFYRGWIPCALRAFPTNGAAFVAAEFALKLMPEQLEYDKLWK